MPPVSQAQLLSDCADEIRRLAVYLKDGGVPTLAINGLKHQLGTLRRISSATKFTSIHSYKNFRAIRSTLASAATTIEGHANMLEDRITQLENNPHDEDVLFRVAMMAPELKSIPFAPPLEGEVAGAGSRLTLDTLDSDED